MSKPQFAEYKELVRQLMVTKAKSARRRRALRDMNRAVALWSSVSQLSAQHASKHFDRATLAERKLDALTTATKELVALCLDLRKLGYVHKDSLMPIEFSPDGPLADVIALLEDHRG